MAHKKLMTNPTISVIMPVFNEALQLAEAIDSILQQTYPDFEFIIINDASTDDSLSIIESYQQKDNRIKVINHQSNQGLSKSLNHGIEKSKGKWIARMDADDISLPERFEKQICFLEQNPSISVVSTGLICVTPDNKVLYKSNLPENANLLAWRTAFAPPAHHGTVMMETKFVREIGGYNPEFVLEDVELWTRLIRKARFSSIPDHLYLYRRTEAELVEVSQNRKPTMYEINRNFVSGIINKDIPLDLYIPFHQSKESNYTCDPSIAKQTINLLLLYYHSLLQTNMIDVNDLELINQDLSDRITNLFVFSQHNDAILQKSANTLAQEEISLLYWQRKMPKYFASFFRAIFEPGLIIKKFVKK